MDDGQDGSTVSNNSRFHIDSGPSRASNDAGGIGVPNDPQASQPTTVVDTLAPPVASLTPSATLGQGYLGTQFLTPKSFSGRTSPIQSEMNFNMFIMKPAKHIRFLTFAGHHRVTASEGIVFQFSGICGVV
jgi:hypothetical protein